MRGGAGAELGERGFQSDRGADPAGENGQSGQAQAVAQRHAPAMQRVGLDRVDDVARPPAPHHIRDQAVAEPADARHQDAPPRVDIGRPAEMRFDRHAEQQGMHPADHLVHQRDAERDRHADRRGHDAEAKLVLADVLADEESGSRAQMRKGAAVRVEFFFFGGSQNSILTREARIGKYAVPAASRDADAQNEDKRCERLRNREN